MKTLLDGVDRPMVAYLAIGGFAGLRQAELMRLDWADVKLEEGHIEIKATKAKTAQRRIVPISHNLAQWLCEVVVDKGSIATGDGSRFLRRVTRYAEEQGIRWPHNVLRHSFASYRLAQCKNAAEVALEMGNTPRMVFQHYRELVTPAEAQKWWSICPRPRQAPADHEQETVNGSDRNNYV